MYGKSIEHKNDNLDTLCPELFEKIITDLTYKSTLVNLAMTSKALQLQVLETSCGEYVKELRAMQPTYIRTLFTKDEFIASFCVGGTYLSAAVGAYYNYDSILSTYAGALGGMIMGGVISSTVSGYAIDGLNGIKIGLSGYASVMNPMPLTKAIIKMQLTGVAWALSYVTQKKIDAPQNIIKEEAMEVLDGYVRQCRRTLGLFKEINTDYESNLQKKIAEKHEQLSQPITRNGL